MGSAVGTESVDLCNPAMKKAKRKKEKFKKWE